MSTRKDNFKIGTRVRYTGEPTKIAPIGRFTLNSRLIETGEIGTIGWSALEAHGKVSVKFDGIIGSSGMVPVTDLEVVTDA